MSLLRPALSNDADPRIETVGYYLRPPVMADFREWADLRAASHDFLKPWEPIWPEDDLTKAGFRRRLRRYAKEKREGRSVPLLLFSAKSHEILGGLTLSNIRRGVSQSVTLGYWMGARHAGKGHMSAAVSAALPFCFDTLGLHRVEAACLTSNDPSIRLLQKAGFKREGYARNYLLINGMWQDHILFACLAEDHAMTRSGLPFSYGGKLKEIL
ncbi:GNAT family N-acetyltransferase [Roseibium sp.]|uniref:GNAT family N-acetyltransferase n=1 Tax=Roseibium sp. TaxID=1936156 RepID=UPI003A9862B5